MKSPLIIAATASLGLACLKLLAFSLTGSMIVLSSFFDSTVDSVVSLINHQVFKYAESRLTTTILLGMEVQN